MSFATSDTIWSMPQAFIWADQEALQQLNKDELSVLVKAQQKKWPKKTFNKHTTKKDDIITELLRPENGFTTDWPLVHAHQMVVSPSVPPTTVTPLVLGLATSTASMRAPSTPTQTMPLVETHIKQCKSLKSLLLTMSDACLENGERTPWKSINKFGLVMLQLQDEQSKLGLTIKTILHSFLANIAFGIIRMMSNGWFQNFTKKRNHRLDNPDIVLHWAFAAKVTEDYHLKISGAPGSSTICIFLPVIQEALGVGETTLAQAIEATKILQIFGEHGTHPAAAVIVEVQSLLQMLDEGAHGFKICANTSLPPIVVWKPFIDHHLPFELMGYMNWEEKEWRELVRGFGDGVRGSEWGQCT
ncbi:hypothetical protein BDN71DRAFT_1427574 [Pleurotus eryngii]|uniref:Uncharacterized protein n=1 Tax=Pleurotus eryngii TaxID=5323 RepID=A0A9P6AA45_PLEER|nr:hypothetical protein BDN71DRAFT_1427574 [Pleurotus eryngii]